MGTISKFTVLFEPPFWVGIFERQQGNHYEACKIIFGAEPNGQVRKKWTMKKAPLIW